MEKMDFDCHIGGNVRLSIYGQSGSAEAGIVKVSDPIWPINEGTFLESW
jgi:hypothetical protein